MPVQNVQNIVNNLMKALSLPLYYFTRQQIDNMLHCKDETSLSFFFCFI